MDPIEWRMQQEIFTIITYGCTNHGCVFNLDRGGMHTNGICKCVKTIKELVKKIDKGRV